jgi:hypothetical protein
MDHNNLWKAPHFKPWTCAIYEPRINYPMEPDHHTATMPKPKVRHNQE